MKEIKLLSIIIVSYQRLKDLQDCLDSIHRNLEAPAQTELIVIDNAGLDECRLLCENARAQYVNAGGNLGVSGGRNLGISHAQGDILFFIDDDAEIATTGFDRLLREALQKKTGILAFRVLNYFTGTPNPGELPFRCKTEACLEQSRFVSYFVGAAFALDRKLIGDIGVFAEDFFYGAEEVDLAYRALLKNWRIYYLANLTVLHKKSMIRSTNKTRYFHTMRNRFVIEARYKPFPYYLVSLCFWSGVMFFQAVHDGALKEWFRGLIKGGKDFARERTGKNLIGRDTIAYLKTHEGRLWY